MSQGHLEVGRSNLPDKPKYILSSDLPSSIRSHIGMSHPPPEGKGARAKRMNKCAIILVRFE